MRRYATVVALLAAFAWAGTASAQELAVGAHIGLSTPTGLYADDFGLEAAGANHGFTLGVDAMYPLEMLTEQLSWYSSLSLVRNGTEGSQDRTGSLVDGGFTLVPVMTGLRYDLGTVPSLFITGQAGLLFVRGPAEFYPYGMSGDPSIGARFGYNAGIGFRFSETMSLSAKYYPLGTIDFEYDEGTLQQEVDFIDLQVGIRIF